MGKSEGSGIVNRAVTIPKKSWASLSLQLRSVAGLLPRADREFTRFIAMEYV